MKRILITTTLLILMFSCSKDNCQSIQTKLAEAIANQGECSRVDLIKEDIIKLTPVNCQAKMEAGRLAPVCAFLVDPVVEFTVKAPAKYECKMTKTKEQLKAALSTVCAAL